MKAWERKTGFQLLKELVEEKERERRSALSSFCHVGKRVLGLKDAIKRPYVLHFVCDVYLSRYSESLTTNHNSRVNWYLVISSQEKLN
jgi:hypothetical protein